MLKITPEVQTLEYMRTMPKSRWAWEFMRRNPKYREDYERHKEGALKRNRQGSLEILKLSRPEPEAEKWGLLFFASPKFTAKNAPVFWTQQANPNVITVQIRPRTDDDPQAIVDTIFDLQLFGANRIHLTDSNGVEHVLLQRGNRVVQMLCQGHTLLNGDVKLHFILEAFGTLDARLNTIRRLAKLYDDATENPALSSGWSPHTASLRDALIALDMYIAGKSHADTAAAILGESVIEDGRSKVKGALKNRMYRARRRGIDLMNGEYRDLMK